MKNMSADPVGGVLSLAKKTGLPIEFVAGLALKDELRTLFDSSGKLRTTARSDDTSEARTRNPRQAAIALQAKRLTTRSGRQAQADTMHRRWPKAGPRG